MALYSGFTPTIYADTVDRGSGNGSSEANAMDFVTALATVTAGGVIGVLPGVHVTASTATRWVPSLAPANSGSSGNPIVICCKYPAARLSTPGVNANRTEIQSTGNIRTGTALEWSVNSAALGVGVGTSYVKFYGFYLDQSDALPRPSNGTVLAATGTNHIEFHEFYFDCYNNLSPDPGDMTWSEDNFNAIYCEDSDDLVIKNCYFNGGNGSAAGLNHNASAITIYGCKRFLFEHLDFADVNAMIWIKGSNSAGGETEPYNDGTVRYCRALTSPASGITVANVNTSRGVDIYQNLIVNSGFATEMANDGGGGDAIRIFNNTIVDFAYSALVVADVQTTSAFYNNICYRSSSSSAEFVNGDGISMATGVSPLDYNFYYEAGGAPAWSNNGVVYNSLEAWRTAMGSPKETHSSVTDPLFVGSGSYKLQGGSPALTASSTGGPIGCYITGTEEIGLAADATVDASSETRARIVIRAA